MVYFGRLGQSQFQCPREYAYVTSLGPARLIVEPTGFGRDVATTVYAPSETSLGSSHRCRRPEPLICV